MKIVIILIFSLVCSAHLLSKEVTVIKQWHLSPGANTLDIEKSKKLPQYQNQVDIYNKISKMIEEKKTGVIIAEGCEGEIDQKFQESHYGWSFSKLSMYKDKPNFKDIMALIPLKLKVKFGDKVKVICGDKKLKIKKHMLIFSDIRGYLGFYIRLKEFREKNKKKFKEYSELLLKDEKNKDVDPVEFAKKSTKSKIKEFIDYLKVRNEDFINFAKKFLKKDPVIIIGGLHADDLKKNFDQEKIKNSIVTPTGYNQGGDEKIISDLNNLLK